MSTLRMIVLYLPMWVSRQTSSLGEAADSADIRNGALCLNTSRQWVQRGAIGVGCVVRDERGRFVMACSCSIHGNFTIIEAEAHSMGEALSWLKCRQFDNCVIESNAWTHLASALRRVQFSFVRRSANMATHIAARAGCSLTGRVVWFLKPSLSYCLCYFL
ncbi:conserved hypothetical protein [Ricinus communis]|uniref:RNase H type-1 domain-containing protein n=1 Tax=Ricinus communis TaxID=3988 RepID=B9RTH4_RICCO|nr:conserved hypothetical protein [Ricinus communis]